MDSVPPDLDVFAPLPPEGTDSPAAATSTETWEPTPWPLTVPAPKPADLFHPKFGKAVAVWPYHDPDGRLLFVVARFEAEVDGECKKDVAPFCHGRRVWKDRQGQQRDRVKWHMKAPAKPRPLFNLHHLHEHPEAPFLIVEGEKAAQAAAVLFPDHVAVTWQGGGNAVAFADWTRLAGRSGVIWPDNDEPGAKAARAVITAATAAGAASVAVVAIPEGWPEGWDVADEPPEGLTAGDLRSMIDLADVDAEDTDEGEPEDGAPGSGSALAADIDRAAGMDRMAWEVARVEMARLHRVRVTVLDGLRLQRVAEIRAAAMKKEAPTPGPTDPRGRADLYVDAADLPDVAVELAEHLAAVPYLFDRGGPCRLVHDVQRDASVASALTLHSVVNEAHRVVRPFSYKPGPEGSSERQNVTLPERIGKLYLDLLGRWGLRPLDGVASAPLLHEDGSFRTADGYDATTRLWCEKVPDVVVVDRPTKDDAAAALLVLREHFRTFVFADSPRIVLDGTPVSVVDTAQPPGKDESAALVGVLTALCRPSLHLAPGLLVRAPQFSGSGTGKGLLIRGICAIAFGSPPAAMSAGHDPKEFDKRVTAALIEASPVLFLDNLNGTALQSDVLASALTERPAAVRIMGESRTVLLNPLAFIALTGNGLMLSEDMARRVMISELDAGVENPESRTFRSDFVTDTRAKRKELLEAAMTIWRWGRQQGDALPAGRALGSYGQWSRWCRDPLAALGCADPVERIESAKSDDPRRIGITGIFLAWWKAHHNIPIAASGLADAVKEEIDPGNRGRQFIAARLRALEGTRTGGFVLVRHPRDGKWSADLYHLTQTDNAPPPPERPAPPPKDDSTGWQGAL